MSELGDIPNRDPHSSSHGEDQHLESPQPNYNKHRHPKLPSLTHSFHNKAFEGSDPNLFHHVNSETQLIQQTLGNQATSINIDSSTSETAI